MILFLSYRLVRSMQITRIAGRESPGHTFTVFVACATTTRCIFCSKVFDVILISQNDIVLRFTFGAVRTGDIFRLRSNKRAVEQCSTQQQHGRDH